MTDKTLCLDFDGVCHSYASGWQGATVIPDPPVQGMWEALQAYQEYFTVAIYSSRSHQDGGVAAMRQWFLLWADADFSDPKGWNSWRHVIVRKLQFPTEKPAAWATIDDRGITFDGTWPDVQSLLDFRPWNKRT